MAHRARTVSAVIVGIATAASCCCTSAAATEPTRGSSVPLPGSADRLDARDVVRLNFDYITEPDGSPIDEIRVSGSANVAAAIVRRGGGEIAAATSRPAQGRAVELPDFDGSADAPRAVIRLTHLDGRDRLNPRSLDFSFGADFVLDAVSSDGESTDNGDNLVQRGLYDDRDQYKLELDRRRPSCRVKGRSDGAPASITVTSPVTVDSTHWYGADCVREGRSLSVVVKRFNGDGTSTTTTTTAAGPSVIDIRMRRSSVPLSIGGKLYADGSIAADSDQFNGRVDNVFLQRG